MWPPLRGKTFMKGVLMPGVTAGQHKEDDWALDTWLLGQLLHLSPALTHSRRLVDARQVRPTQLTWHEGHQNVLQEATLPSETGPSRTIGATHKTQRGQGRLSPGVGALEVPGLTVHESGHVSLLPARPALRRQLIC